MLRWSHRTRLLIVCGDEFLVLRGWLGDGTWGLPGGGLHRHEKPIDGVLREVQEEIGVVLQPKQITYAFEDYVSQRGLKFHYYGFVAELTDKPAVSPQPREIAAIVWQPLKNPNLPLNEDTKAILAWRLKTGPNP